jgi:hypothetical protein
MIAVSLTSHHGGTIKSHAIFTHVGQQTQGFHNEKLNKTFWKELNHLLSLHCLTMLYQLHSLTMLIYIPWFPWLN